MLLKENLQCPACKIRYTDSFSFCPRDGQALVNYQEKEMVEETKRGYLLYLRSGEELFLTDEECQERYGPQAWKIFKRNNFDCPNSGLSRFSAVQFLMAEQSGKLKEFMAEKREYQENRRKEKVLDGEQLNKALARIFRK